MSVSAWIAAPLSAPTSVVEPPVCTSSPGLSRAASTKSEIDLYGESGATAITSGSVIKPATGVRSSTVTVAPSIVCGVVSQVVVMAEMCSDDPRCSSR